MRILKKTGIKAMLMCCIIVTLFMCVTIICITLIQYKQYQRKK